MILIKFVDNKEHYLCAERRRPLGGQSIGFTQSFFCILLLLSKLQEDRRKIVISF